MTQEPFLVRIARSWGWRAYAIPVLVVLTVIILCDIFTAEDDPFDSGNGTVASQNGNGRSGPVPGEGYGDDYEGGQLPPGPAYATESSGNFKDVTVAHPRVGEGRRNAVRYSVEIEDNIDVPSIGGERAFAETVNSILVDPRGWTADPNFSFEAVPRDQNPTIVVQLSATGTAHQLCGNTLGMETSCFLSGRREGEPGRVIVSIARWVRGALPFEGDLGLYRQYLINHEVGHGLGYAVHEPCPRDGGIAPIMMQQTLSVSNDELHEIDSNEVYQADGKTCSVNGWPYPFGADDDTAAPTQKAR